MTLPATRNGTEERRRFEDLETYPAAREFRKRMYGVTRKLPAVEKHELAGLINGYARYLRARRRATPLGASQALHETAPAYDTDENPLAELTI